MLPAAATRPQYLRHFDASIVQFMGPDPRGRREDRMTKACTISAAVIAIALALPAAPAHTQPAEPAHWVPSTRSFETKSKGGETYCIFVSLPKGEPSDEGMS